MKRRTAEFRDKQYCGIEYSSEKHIKKTGKEEKKHNNKYDMDQPVAGGAVVMMVGIGMRVKKIRADR